MPTFEYQAQRQDGSVEEGLIDGPSLDNAARDLAAKGLRVTQIGFQSQGEPKERTFAKPSQATVPESGSRSYFEASVAGPVIGKVPLEKLSFFFRQCAAMQKAGVPLVQSLNTLAGQARHPKLGDILREVATNVQAGRPISSVIQRYPEAFSPVIVSMMRAGEEGGFLDEAFSTIANYVDQEIELRNLYRRTTFWPKLELALSIVVILAANTIINAIKPDAQKLSSPLTTAATWYVLLPLLIAGFLFFRVGLANPRVRYNYDIFTSKIPYLGNTLQQIAMARFGRAFGALYKAGVPMQRAYLLAADACGNEYLRAKMYPANRALQAGDGITVTLESTHAFSPIVMDMIRTGETTGNLDQMLNRSSDFYIEEARIRQHQLGIAVGILIGTFVAVYIGYIVVTFWMNYMANMQNVSGGGI